MDFEPIRIFLFGDPDFVANYAIFGAIASAVGGSLFSGLLGGLFGGGGKKDNSAAEERTRTAEAKAETEAREAERKARVRETRSARRLRESFSGPGQGLLAFFNSRFGR